MPRLLDLFCGAGGCSVGYARAGFEVMGVDLHPQPDYPFEFHQGDALAFLAQHGHKFDAIHASPPCPRYSRLTVASGDPTRHPDLVPPTRALLVDLGRPYVIENVPGAPIPDPLILCGSEFGLGAHCRDGVWRQLRRHRLFETPVFMMRPAGCAHRGEPVGVYGHGGSGSKRTAGSRRGYQATKREAADALGIDWIGSMRGLSNAIPPAYTAYIGAQLRAAVEVAA